MVQGTASSVGKSLLVTALCRILRDDGLRVAPFKAQNMSNNSYVAANGGELGRAQVNQAEAAGIPPHTDMNPILLKPESDRRSQVVVNGRPFCSAGAGEYQRLKPELWPYVSSALDRLREDFDAVIIEGAGSPAEINLRASDIVNMRVARYAAAPVLLVGDIDRGGVFAHLVGTLELLEPEERELIAGFVINKFRGDRSLLEPGLEMLFERTGVAVAGVVPYLPDVGVADEDSVALDDRRTVSVGALDVAVIKLPHISNFDDFDPLDRDPSVALRYVSSAFSLGRPDLIILPGSKATVADLGWLIEQRLDSAIASSVRGGSAIIGICGGYQMLCETIEDPLGVESSQPSVPGIGVLSGVTSFTRDKTTTRASGRISGADGLLAGLAGTPIEGYEIHMGQTPTMGSPAFRIGIEGHDDGCVSPDGWALGTYLHGLFANDGFRQGLLSNLAARRGLALAGGHFEHKDEAYDRLAAVVRSSLNMDLVHRLLEQPAQSPSLNPAWER